MSSGVHKRVLSVVFLVGLMILGISIVNRQERQLLQPKAQAQTVTFTPQALPSTEIVTGPMRGYYKWRDQQEIVTNFLPSQDYYQRYDWNDLEQTRDSYQFDQKIRPDIEEAIAAGQKFAFRVRAILSENDDSLLPQYIKNTPECVVTSGQSVNLPIWDAGGNDCFRARGNKLLVELGNWLRANNYMKHVAWVDIGMYGQFGEWACSWCASEASLATKNEIIDWHVASFGQDARLVMMAKTDPKDPVGYALTRTTRYPVGWRVDCLGSDDSGPNPVNRYFNFDSHPEWTAIWNSVMQDRWKTAPVITEWCARGPNLDTAERDVNAFHIGLLSNGNFVNGNLAAQQAYWNGLSQTDKDRFIAMGRLAGGRLSLTNITMPASLTANATMAITADWQNLGNAPLYEDYLVQLQLRQNGQTVTQIGLSQKLTTALPGNTQYGENPSLGNVSVGIYDLYLIVVDPNGVRRPLNLAMVGREGDGAYRLGSIGVGTIAPTVTPTIMFSPTPTAASGNPQTPTPTIKFTGCNANCGRGSDCASGLICELGFCRNPACREDRDCVCAPPGGGVAPSPTRVPTILVRTPTPTGVRTPSPTIADKGDGVGRSESTPTLEPVFWVSPTPEGIQIEPEEFGGKELVEQTWWQKFVKLVIKIVTFGQF